MRFWDEMNTKYGFGDGKSCPDGIEIYRDIYVKTVSKLAEHLGSDFRVVPYNRGGVHNVCLWFFVSKKWFENVYLSKQASGKPWSAATEDDIQGAESEFFEKADDMMDEAISLAFDLGIDGFVQFKAKQSKEFERFLKTCHQAIVGTQSKSSTALSR